MSPEGIYGTNSLISTAMASPEVNSNDKTQIIDPESKMAEERTFKMMVACVVFAMIIAVLSLIISFVAITMKGTNQYNISTGSSGNQYNMISYDFISQLN